MKAGVTLVAYHSDGQNDAVKLSSVLNETAARGLLFAPYTQCEDARRIDTLYSLAPQL